jgi:hypothetical protein
VRLARVDDVRELDGVLDEEHRDVVADQIEGALVGVELRREAAGVPDGVGRSARAEDRGEPDEDRRLLPLAEEAGPGDRSGGAVAGEHAVRSGSARVDDALGNALVVEVGDLLAEVMILQEDRAAGPGLQRMVRVAKPRPLGGGEVRTLLTVGGGGRAGFGAGRRPGLRRTLLVLRWQWFVRGGRLLDGGRSAARCAGDIGRQGIGYLRRGGLHDILHDLGGLAGIHLLISFVICCYRANGAYPYAEQPNRGRFPAMTCHGRPAAAAALRSALPSRTAMAAPTAYLSPAMNFRFLAEVVHARSSRNTVAPAIPMIASAATASRPAVARVLIPLAVIGARPGSTRTMPLSCGAAIQPPPGWAARMVSGPTPGHSGEVIRRCGAPLAGSNQTTSRPQVAVGAPAAAERPLGLG